MYYRLPSYDNWYADCYCGYNTPEEPCWGEVYITDEYEMEDGDWDCIYTCEGHAGGLSTGHHGLAYIKSTLPQDQNVEPIEVE